LRGAAFVAAAGFAEIWVEGCDESGVDLAEVVVFLERGLAADLVDGNMDLAGFVSRFEGVAFCAGGCFWWC
jgi:hypothetical protein